MKPMFPLLAVVAAVSAAPAIIDSAQAAISSAAAAASSAAAAAVSKVGVAAAAATSAVASAAATGEGIGADILGELGDLALLPEKPIGDENDIQVTVPTLFEGLPGLKFPKQINIPMPAGFNLTALNLTAAELVPDLSSIPKPMLPQLPLNANELAEFEEGGRFRFTLVLHPKSVDVTVAPEAGSNSTSANSTTATSNTTAPTDSKWVNAPGESRIGFWDVKAVPKSLSAMAPRPLDLEPVMFDVESLLNQPALWLFERDIQHNYTTGFDITKYEKDLQDYFKSIKIDIGNNTNATAEITKSFEGFINETITNLNTSLQLWDNLHMDYQMKGLMTYINGSNSGHQLVTIIGLAKPPTVGSDGTVSWTWAVEARKNVSLQAGTLDSPTIIINDAYCTRGGDCCAWEACPMSETPTPTTGEIAAPIPTVSQEAFPPAIASDPAEAFNGTRPSGTTPQIITDSSQDMFGPTPTPTST